MKLAIIFVGIGQWTEYTEPLIKSLLKYQSDAVLIGVDNGNMYTEKERNKYSKITWVSIEDESSENEGSPVSYSKALNSGLKLLEDNPVDWILLINNDVLCLGNSIPQLSDMKKDTIYGNKLHHQFKVFEHEIPFTDGWIIALPYNIFKVVGYFDENFVRACAEDADYCFRAGKQGFKVLESNLPFKHLGYHIRTKMDNYKEFRWKNIRYLMKKHNLKERI
jgi:GT2 family glycosyltransferase